jgi:hypothetical protein
MLHRYPDDQLPYYVGELVWRELREEEIETALERVKYPMFNQRGAFYPLNRVVTVHLEGGVCCDILAEDVALVETPSSS